MINIKGLGKAEVLAALHNGTQALGMGMLHDIGRDMTADEASKAIESIGGAREIYGKPSLYFDYLLGRPLKVDIGGDEFDERLYDRDAGRGAADRAITRLRASLEQAGAA